jgi:hypothetical protein
MFLSTNILAIRSGADALTPIIGRCEQPSAPEHIYFMEDRFCNTCEKTKPVTDFHTNQYDCRDCRNAGWRKQNAAKPDYMVTLLLLPGEIWKDIPGYEGIHEISNRGRLSALMYSIGPYFRKYDKRHILNVSCGSGYPAHSFAKWGRHNSEKRQTIHRLTAQAFIPNPHKLKEVNHIDGNKFNNDVSNLEWCNRSSNINHSYANKLHPVIIGEKNKAAKLTNQEVLDIFNSPLGPRALSRLLDGELGYSTIAHIKNGSKWAHVTGGREAAKNRKS